MRIIPTTISGDSAKIRNPISNLKFLFTLGNTGIENLIICQESTSFQKELKGPGNEFGKVCVDWKNDGSVPLCKEDGYHSSRLSLIHRDD